MISVIIPVYNVKEYLEECLDSVINQTFTDLEVICVDDGSTDGSGEILDRYAEKDERVKVLHRENGGYGKAMNAGLDAAGGEYIGIVESDDSIEPDFFETLYAAVKEHDLDIVKSGCWFCWESYDYRVRFQDGLDKYRNKMIGKDRLWLRCLFLMNIWSGLYRRDFLIKNGIRFHETPGASYQDNGFWMQGMIFAENVMFLDYSGYRYRQDREGTSVKDPKKVYTMADEYEWMAEYLKDKVSPRETDVINAFRLIREYWSFYRVGDEFKREFADRLVKDYEKYGDVFFRDLTFQDYYLGIIEDPEAFCEKVKGEKKELERCLENADHIMIYGAGKRGGKIYSMLINYGFIDKLQCFIETGTPKKSFIGKHPVYNIDDPGVSFNKAAVIISTARGSGVYNEMKEKLKGYPAGKVLDSELLTDNYYSLV